MNKYSLLGSVRRVVQSIRFECNFILLLLITVLLYNKYFLLNNFFFLSIIILFLSLVDTHRSPFDLSESESELVSGYNTEYIRLVFTLVFLAEYNIIVFFSVLISFFFSNYIIFFFILTILLIRSSLPRVRYDIVM